MPHKFIQVSSKEQSATKNWCGPDLRQAKSVLKHRPDIIIFELANSGRTPETIYNKYNCINKPYGLIKEHIKKVRRSARNNYPEALADIPIWENIAKLWKDNHNVFVYRVDIAKEFRLELFDVWQWSYPCIKKNWFWWVPMYIREKIMAKNINWILQKHKNEKNLTIAIFIQKEHWGRIKFLMKNPSKKKIWNLYFGKFKEISPKNITQKIKEINKMYYKYWMRISDFE